VKIYPAHFHVAQASPLAGRIRRGNCWLGEQAASPGYANKRPLL